MKHYNTFNYSVFTNKHLYHIFSKRFKHLIQCSHFDVHITFCSSRRRLSTYILTQLSFY